MHFPSVVPTLLLAALTFSGLSQQTPVEVETSLEPRQITTDINFLVAAFGAISFTLEQILSLFNTVVTDFQNLYASLASKVNTFDYLTKLYLQQTWAALRVSVLKVADNVVRTINRVEVTQNRDKLDQVFAQADVTFKVRSGTGRE
ncbi:hypothetical protein MMC07_008842 [Pseudocyphellaria aurata]|nr:hypothetical protein [Pseudocyphellaria aurata]